MEFILRIECNSIIYLIITKTIRYLLWNRRFWCALNNAYPIFLTPCIPWTNHLCDSCDLTDVNPHFIPSRLRMIKNVDLLWHHRYRSQLSAIVTSQWPIRHACLLWTLSWHNGVEDRKKSVKPWNVWQVTSWLTSKGQCARHEIMVLIKLIENTSCFNFFV